MEFEKITSRDNSLIKLTRELVNSAKIRREHSLFVIEGLRICAAAADNGVIIRELFFTEEFARRHESRLHKIAEYALNSREIMPHVAQKISETTSPQGIYCVCEMPASPDISSFCTKTGRILALENIQDPGNLGTMARTAEALGFDGLILSPGCCDVYNPKTLRASMGAFFRIPMHFAGDFAACIRSIDIPKYACVADNSAEDIRNMDFTSGAIILIGNEGAGLTESAISTADIKITIPMKGQSESLCAASAAAIVMWRAIDN